MTELLAGLALGLGAGIAPGPLLTLVVTGTLERGFGAGLRVAIAPLLTDAPIIGLTVALVSSVSDGVLRVMGITGGIIVASMGIWTILTTRMALEPAELDPGPADVWRGVFANALSPHPWIFWIGIGAPLLVTAWRRAPSLGIAFLVGFYALLVGSKIAIAWVVARGRRRLSTAWRGRLVVIGGLLLSGAGMVLVWEAATGRL